MSKVLERAKAHFKALPKKQIEVPEWGEDGKPLVVTWAPLTMADIRRIGQPNGDGSSAGSSTMQLRAVILKACDENGERLFDEFDDEDALVGLVDGSVLSRIGLQILYNGGKPKPLDDLVGDAKNG